MNISGAERNARTQYHLAGVFALLMGIGLACVATASLYYAGQHEDSDFNPGYYISRQAMWAVAAVFAYAACARISYRRLKIIAPMLFVLTYVFTLLVFTSLGVDKRWVQLGPVRLQPSEFLKWGMILMMAWLLSRTGGTPRALKGFFQGFVLLALCGGIVLLQHDLGTALVIVLVGLGMLAAANAYLTHLGALASLLTVVVWLGVRYTHYRWERIAAWLRPWDNAEGVARQTVHALHALGSGGLLGVGLGQGLEKYHLPAAPHTDFIFATIAEETGIFGPAAILLLFLAIAFLGMTIALVSREPFGRLAAIGVVVYLCGQAALNIAVATNSVPCTGIPLPFISYGGSSLISAAMVFGLLSSLSKGAVRRAEENVDENHGDGWGDRWAHFSGPGGDFGASSPGVRGPSLVRR